MVRRQVLEGAAGRRAVAETIAGFLDSAPNVASALVIEGDAGIGKTTQWLDALRRADACGFRVLSARAAAAESVLAYTALRDLLAVVEDSMWADLPTPQRRALDAALLRHSDDARGTDAPAVAAAFLAIINRLAEQSPVVVAIDDLQWLDISSANVVSFAARRLPEGVALMCTMRSDVAAVRLQLPRPDAVHRIRLPPMTVGELHQVLTSRLGGSLARPALLRIHEICGGNPFYAIELGRAIASETIRADTPLPGTLAELVHARIGTLSGDTQDVLLATACNATPTVELLALALQADQNRLAGLLDEAQDKGIVVLDGHRIRFTHPLLAHGVYTSASTSRRREMHQRMAEVVDEPELRARHLAFATVKGDAMTLESLDAAAEMARTRGAPADAAELLELAISLGGDTPQRRILLAGCRFNSGDGAHARIELEMVAAGDVLPVLRAEALNLLALISHLEGTLPDAANELGRALEDAGDNLELRARILTALSWVQIHRFDQHVAAAPSIQGAVASAEQLGEAQPLSEALGMNVVIDLLVGNGLDDRTLSRALELEAGTAAISVMFRPTVQNAMALSWTGRVDAAHDEFVAIRQNCIDRGEESELVFVSFHTVLNEIWRADFSYAALVAEDTVERARHLPGSLPLAAALVARAMAAAYAGNEGDARRDSSEAIGPIVVFGSQLLKAWALAPLGLLDVSLGNYQAAIDALKPLLDRLTEAPDAAEIFATGFVPDAVEALIQLGRLDEAEPVIDFLERNGRRLDRPWMLAVGARGRGMLLAADGDLDAANVAVRRAMAEHDRLPMPFERARTQLLLGQIQRRQRRRENATATLQGALQTFQRLGTALWADRAGAELARGTPGRRRAEGLTPSEYRVAELAAAGMSNKHIAATLFISPKTVEVNLSRIYRKLGVHSRVELFRAFEQSTLHPPKQ